MFLLVFVFVFVFCLFVVHVMSPHHSGSGRIVRVIGGCVSVTSRNRGQDHDQDGTKVMCEG